MRTYHTAAWVLAAVMPCQLWGASLPNGFVIGWGNDIVGEATGVPTPGLYSTGVVMIGGQPLTNATAIAAGAVASLAITADGSVVEWGAVVDEPQSDSRQPQRASEAVQLGGQPLRDVIAIATTRSEEWPGFNLALKRNGELIAWGGNQFGQTSLPKGLTNIFAISAGSFQGLALKADGTVASWGEGNPPPPGLSNVVAISAAGMYGRDLAMRRDGTVIDWPVRSAIYDVTVPAGLSNVVAISAGWGHSLALKHDGTVVGWGFNDVGQATGTPSAPPAQQATGLVMVAGKVLTDIVAIAAAQSYSLALKHDGTVCAWGQLGRKPVAVPEGLSKVVAISASRDYCLAITTNKFVADRFRVHQR